MTTARPNPTALAASAAASAGYVSKAAIAWVFGLGRSVVRTRHRAQPAGV